MSHTFHCVLAMLIISEWWLSQSALQWHTLSGPPLPPMPVPVCQAQWWLHHSGCIMEQHCKRQQHDAEHRDSFRFLCILFQNPMFLKCKILSSLFRLNCASYIAKRKSMLAHIEKCSKSQNVKKCCWSIKLHSDSAETWNICSFEISIIGIFTKFFDHETDVIIMEQRVSWRRLNSSSLACLVSLVGTPPESISKPHHHLNNYSRR